MQAGSPFPTLGIVDPTAGLRNFELRRIPPDERLASLVEHFWIVRWALPAGRVFQQEVLPHPSFNLSIEPHLSAVHGIGTRRFVATLSGSGRVVAAKFRAGCFSPFVTVPIASLVDRIVPLSELFGSSGNAVAEAVLAEPDDHRAARSIEDFLVARAPRVDAHSTLAMQLVERARTDRTITRAAQLARIGALSLRSLHRLFERAVGVSPKWVIRRARVHEAAERVAHGARIDWASLAQELGYHDQSHLIRDFRDEMGETPAAYAARCRASAAAAREASAHGEAEATASLASRSLRA